MTRYYRNGRPVRKPSETELVSHNGWSIRTHIQRLFERTQNDPETGCTNWLGHVTMSGHGSIAIEGKPVKVHRYVWEHFKGPIPAGICVLHRCDNPRCVTLDHLFLGTQGDNNRDRAAKGRTVVGDRKGEANGMCILTETDVKDIRRLGVQKGITQQEIADTCGVRANTVSRVLSGKRWAWIPGATPTHGPRKGEKHHAAKMDEDTVREIRSSPLTGRELALKYAVAESCISKIRSGTLWAHVDGAKPQERRIICKMTPEIVREIRSSDLSGVELSQRYGINQSSISAIRNRKSWTHIV